MILKQDVQKNLIQEGPLCDTVEHILFQVNFASWWTSTLYVPWGPLVAVAIQYLLV